METDSSSAEEEAESDEELRSVSNVNAMIDDDYDLLDITVINNDAQNADAMVNDIVVNNSNISNRIAFVNTSPILVLLK